jgi:hypothetical protein
VSKKGGGKPEATRDGCVIAHMLERAAGVSVLVLDYTKTPSHWTPSQVLPSHALLAASRSAVAVAVGSVTNHEPLPGNTAAYPGEEGGASGIIRVCSSSSPSSSSSSEGGGRRDPGTTSLRTACKANPRFISRFGCRRIGMQPDSLTSQPSGCLAHHQGWCSSPTACDPR